MPGGVIDGAQNGEKRMRPAPSTAYKVGNVGELDTDFYLHSNREMGKRGARESETERGKGKRGNGGGDRGGRRSVDLNHRHPHAHHHHINRKRQRPASEEGLWLNPEVDGAA